MTEQADSNIVDVFKERLASPFLFTFFWVSCTWNWKVIYWFLYEPLKPSLKLVQMPFEWGVGWPILITVAVITVVPWINNAVEIIKQYAEHNLNLWLHKLKWKKMVTEVEYQKLVDEVAQLKEKQHKLINDNVAAQQDEKEAKEKLVSSQAEVNLNLDRISKLEEDISEIANKHKKSYNENVKITRELVVADKKLEDVRAVSSEQIKILENKRGEFHGPSLDLATSFHDGHSKIIALIDYDNSKTAMQHFIDNKQKK